MNAAGGFASARAQAVVDYLKGVADYPFARMIGSASLDGADAVDLVVEPELPQHYVVRIEAEEPIRIVFDHDDGRPPFVYSTRKNFPIDLVHTTMESIVAGRSLCIWEEGWADLRRNLTSQALIERIRDWFARTAQGELHQDGQPVEPLIPATSNTLILPPSLPSAGWHIVYSVEHAGRWIVALGELAAAALAPFAVFTMTLPAQVHGSLRRAPVDMEGLCNTIRALGGDLVSELGNWLVEAAQMATPERRAIMIIMIPLLKVAEGAIEAWETWVFMAIEPFRQLGTRIGRTLYDAESRTLGLRIGRGHVDLTGIDLLRWRVLRRLDRAAARLHAGRNGAPDQVLVAVGAGAIGSNVIVNTAHAGIGTWTIIDDDVVLPHNTVRQVQGDADVGQLKAESTKRLACRLLAENMAEAIAADVLSPGDAAPEVARAFGRADLVVDFSASPAVLGHVADHDAVKRGASMFFNPDGRDLVVIAENSGRLVRLDEAEAQYFLAVATDPALVGHLNAARLDFVRYGNACQDLSRPLPPWQVQTLCGLASGQLAALACDGGAGAKIWRLDPETGGIVAIDIPIEPVRRLRADGFRVTLSKRALGRMRRMRHETLPDETGGVLVGTFDLGRTVAHVVDALPAPPDSLQAPTFFVRGKKDLQPRVAALALKSAGALGYLGEWHSHPAGVSTRPSTDDENVWQHLERHIGPTGAPHLMMIIGDSHSSVRIGWRPHGCSEHEVPHDEA